MFVIVSNICFVCTTNIDEADVSMWDSISDLELKRQEIPPLQFYYDDIDIEILHYAISNSQFKPNHPALQI